MALLPVLQHWQIIASVFTYGVTQMLQDLHIVCFDTILFNSRSKFESLWNSSHNNIVRLLHSLGL